MKFLLLSVVIIGIFVGANEGNRSVELIFKKIGTYSTYSFLVGYSIQCYLVAGNRIVVCI